MKYWQWYVASLITISLIACVEPYDPPLEHSDVNHVVIDGFLNASEHYATVSVTRTLPVKSTEQTPPESGAYVRIVDNEGWGFLLTETAPGRYGGYVGPVDTERQYQLLVRTRDNRNYASDFVKIMKTPPIDSISYTIEEGGIEFSVNTHDPSGYARHFRWKSIETFEYHSDFHSGFIITPQGVEMRTPEEAINICWKTNDLTNIMVGSTKHLKESVVNHFPVSFIPYGSIQLSVRYSVLVQQQTLTEQAYTYWLSLEKSTEQIGGMFDPLPSEVAGNIHSVNDPGEVVLGFFSGSTVEESRRYLSRNELPESLWSLYRRNNFCPLDTIPLAEMRNVSPATFLVGGVYSMMGGLIGYTFSMRHCIDCTALGGTTVKPPFWE